VKAGIIGGRAVGKSTVFHALTGLAPQAGAADAKNRARPGQIKVPDSRLDFLERIYSSKKRVPVELVVVDFAPGAKEQKPGAALDSTMIPLMRELDAILIVIPAFTGSAVPFVTGLESVEAELVFADFEQAERRLERLKKEKGASEMERTTLERCIAQLEAGKPLRQLDFNPQELQVMSHFCFLSQKPAIAVINC
jgi:ribosome-binding ATPase YchF (GTP1/OBG family)